MSWLLLTIAFIAGAAFMFIMICLVMAIKSTDYQVHPGPMATSGNSPRPKVNPMAKLQEGYQPKENAHRKPIDSGNPPQGGSGVPYGGLPAQTVNCRCLIDQPNWRNQ